MFVDSQAVTFLCTTVSIMSFGCILQWMCVCMVLCHSIRSALQQCMRSPSSHLTLIRLAVQLRADKWACTKTLGAELQRRPPRLCRWSPSRTGVTKLLVSERAVTPQASSRPSSSSRGAQNKLRSRADTGNALPETVAGHPAFQIHAFQVNFKRHLGKQRCHSPTAGAGAHRDTWKRGRTSAMSSRTS